MNYEKIESLLTEAEAENKKRKYAEAEQLCHLALEKIPIFSAQETVKSEEDFQRISTLRVRALIELSTSLWRRGMPKEAISPAEEALHLSIQAENKEQECKALNSIGNVNMNLSDYPRALDYFTKAVAIYEEIGDKYGVAANTGNIGNMYRLVSDYPRAMEYCSKALVINEEIGDKYGLAANTGNIGLIYHNLSDYPRALEFLNKALSISEEIGNKNGVAINTLNIGNVYLDLSDHPRALEYYSKALAIIEEIGDKYGLATTTGNIGIVYYNLSDYPHALEYFTKALAIHEEIGDKNGVALNTGNIGNVYTKLCDYPRALDYFTKAVAIYEEIGDKYGVAANTGNIGNMYRLVSDYPRAMEYCSKALVINEEIGDKYGLAANTGNIGLIYHNLSDYPRALEFLNKALSISEEIGNKNGVAINTLNIGNVYLDLSDHPRALEYYSKALAIIEEIGDKYGLATTTGNIGIVYYNLSDYPHALEYFTKALVIHEEIGNKSGIAANTGNIGSMYYHLSNYHSALEYYNRALAIYEEIGIKYGQVLNIASIGKLYGNKEFEGYDADKAEDYLLHALALNEEIGAKVFEVHKSLADLYVNEKRWEDALEQFKKFYEIEKEVLSEEAKKQGELTEYRRKIEESERDRQLKLAGFKAKENILHRVLPAQIAERIAEGEENIADYFPAVSILFADIEGFTPMSADMPAYVVVKFLNHVFSEFDHIMKKHVCEKIKTIGDGYMAVAGAPTECVDHAERIALAALEMMKPIELPDEIKTFIPSGKKFSIRIGMHTGSVVAGVVGEDRFVYDIYSDAVNTAARMESHGESGKIHVSSDFMRHLLNRFAQTKNTTHGIIFENRGEMEVKGKGMMKTYFLEGN